VNRTLRMTLDPDLFVDALGNLVQNAVKYTSQGFVRVEVQEFPTEVRFRVSDSGPGISEDRMRDLFTPVLPAQGGGAGIGLAVAQRAVQALGGVIEVESKEGQGSDFWFRLPRSVAAKNVAA
jgi:two-component system sensor histidine kinase TorS